MSPRPKSAGSAASVRARLLNIARQRKEEFQLILSDFAIERLLYRLGVSPQASDYVLKGATLLRLWSVDRYRATWDLDLLGHGPSSLVTAIKLVRDLCAIQCEDGIEFDAGSVIASEIDVPEPDSPVRVQLSAGLAGARIPMQVDFDFGDHVVPDPRHATFPVLLDHPAPRVLVYPPEAVVAEKLEAAPDPYLRS